MQDAKQGLSVSKSRTALILLLVVDAFSFVSLGQGSTGLDFGLVANTASWIGLGVDLALAIGLIKAADWALELGRYRCVLGLCYLVFIWISYFVVLRTSVGLVDQKIMVAGMVRDGWLAVLLFVALFILRERKQAVIPNSKQTKEDADKERA